MGQLHYCHNGCTVTEQVVLFQSTRSSEDYLPVQYYYDDYKEIWFKQVSDYMDRSTFDGEFDFKLFRAVDSYDPEEAQRLARQKSWSTVGMFNRWFYRILSNWKSNVKTSSYRVKKRPSVTCPICNRQLGRIDAEHLQHYKTVRDVPRVVVYQGMIYETKSKPDRYAWTYGKSGRKKFKELLKGHSRLYDKRRVRWPWKLDNGRKAVLCPFTKKLVETIDDEYIRSLSDRHNRYAEPMSWEHFIEHFPYSLIQEEVYRLDYPEFDDSPLLRDKVDKDHRLSGVSLDIDLANIRTGIIPTKYEHSFYLIDKFVSDNQDREILKLIAIGYSIDDVADSLSLDKSVIKIRVKSIRESSDDLVEKLVESPNKE